MNKDDLIKLHNTLAMIETKGESTKIMAQCLQFIEQKLNKPEKNAAQTESVPA